MSSQEFQIEKAELKAKIAALEDEIACLREAAGPCIPYNEIFDQFASLTKDALVVHDDNRRIVYINSSGVELFGANSADEILGTLITQYIRPDVRQEADRQIDEILKSVVPLEIAEQPRTRIDGSTYIADVSASAIVWDDKPAVMSNIRDVSGRADINESQEIPRIKNGDLEPHFLKGQNLHRELLEDLPDAVIIHIDERIVFVNPAALRLFGAETDDQLIGKESLSFIPEEDRALQLERRRTVLNKQNQLDPVEQRRIRLDGSIVDVETVATYIEWEGAPAFLGVLRDITSRKHAEEAYAEAQRRFSAVTDNMPGAVFQRVMEPDGKLLYSYASAGIEEITGFSPEDLEKDLAPFIDCIRPDHRDEYYRRMQESAESLTPYTMDLPFVRYDGNTRWLRSTGRPHKRSDGAIIWDGVLMDVTEQRETELRARRAHHWLLQAIDTMPNGFMLWDKDDKLVLWNHRVLTYHPDPAVITEGVSFEKVIGGIADEISNQHGSEIAEKWKAERRRNHLEASGSYESRAMGDRWFTITEHRTSEGFTLTLTADITDRRESETRLRESDERYRALVNLLPDAIYVHKGGYIVLANEAALNLFGANTPDELMGKETLDLTHPEFHETVSERQILVIEQGNRTVFMRQKRLRLDGSWFWAEVGAAAIDWEGERGGIVVMRDVTQQIEAEETLIKSKEQADIANRTKTEFLANISHELRTPLNAIIGFSDLMQREMFGSLGNEQYKDYARDIYQSGSHLHDVINDILDLSKIEAGKLDLSEEEFDLGSCVERCLRVVAPRAEENGLELQSTIVETLPRFRGDERKIKQILINLLSNAVKFTERGGSISVDASYNKSDSIELIVRDTGIGMAQEDLAQALIPFGQVDSTLSRRHEGTGLGLPLTKSLVELHGGTLSVDSTVGQGTSVSIRFPAWRAVDRLSAAE
ncbi:MAG: hypothetical protein CMM52_16015 [Rhodospirillaceae bacterium]|nr:hypothetical protein [Rhodospirillaceae bacterium]|tara:strand:- start:18327 stop:21125 length:2799 start_codon:yes stop_codon:yes gene_type:complete